MIKRKSSLLKLVPQEIIQNKIYLIRGKKIMIDHDLANLYGVETAQLKRQVKRNIERFPDDFMFVLNKNEFKNWRCQIGISNRIKMGLRYAPMAFTEYGILMLSSVLNSKRAVEVNIQIMRTFTRLRKILSTHTELRKKIEEMEKKYDYQFKAVFETIKRLLDPPPKSKPPIGFKPHGTFT